MRPTRHRVIFAKRPGRSEAKRGDLQRRQPDQFQCASGKTAPDMAHNEPSATAIPSHFRSAPILKDSLVTPTSSAQSETVHECLPFLKGIDDPSRNPFDFNEHGVPRLDREGHIEFLQGALGEFPAPFVGIDSSRPWMVYWALMGLHLLGEDVTPFRSRYITPAAAQEVIE